MPKAVVYPGTFDPVTFGHIDLIKRALVLFGSVTVAVTTKPGKEPLFSEKERVALLEESLSGLKGVSVEPFSGLLVDYLKKRDASVIIRGLRALSDFESEFQQAIVNRKLSPSIESVFIMTSAKYFYLSSSVVKEVASLGGDVSCFVPGPVEAALKKRFPQ